MARGGNKKTTTASQRLEKKLQSRQDEAVKAAEEERGATAEELKNEGNALFTAGNSLGALKKFSEAIELDDRNHVLFSNRSGANLKLLRTRDAVADAEACTGLKPDWPKGWSRLGAALLADKQAAKALSAYQTGLKLDPLSEACLQGVAVAEPAAKAEEEAAKAEKKEAEKEEQAEAPKEVDPVIGIDLGTTFSCVAVWGPNGVQILTDEDGMRTVPSYVGWTPAGERLIGHAAKTMAPKHTKSTAYDVKRIIGQRTSDEAVQKECKRFPFPVVSGDEQKPLIEMETKAGQTQQFSPEEISAMVLGRMKQIAEKSLGRTVTKAVITCPAYFNDAQRQATKNAGAIAGLQVLRIINEPTAAALAYGLDQKADDAKGSNILIFDLGGGTFDASILQLDGGMFQVLATGGDTRLGGEDFDNTLVDWLITEFKTKHKLDIKEPKDLAKLKAAAERAKRDMTANQTAKVELSMGGDEYSIDVARAKFESLNSKIFARTLYTVKTVLKDAKLETSEIDDIVLVGGSTRVPKIQELLSEHFGGRQLCRSINPDEAVAYGAAVQGAILAGVRHSLCDSIVLVDVTPLSLGIEVEGKHMSTIIPRNTSVPCTKTSKYTTTENYQECLDVCIYEGERPSTKDNHLLGEFKITGIERAKQQEPEIDVTFALDANGILNVTARDKKTGADAKCTISNACKGLSQKEIERMVEEAARFAKEDAELVKKVALKNEIQSAAFDLQNRGKDKHLAEETLDWLEDVDLVSCPLQTLEARRRELESASA